MSKKKLFLISCAILAFCIGIVVKTGGDSQEGLPIKLHFVSSGTENGKLKVVFRSDVFIPTLSDNEAIMNKEGYVGKMGVHGKCTYVSVPENNTLSLFPWHTQDPKIPDWLGQAISQHPNTVVEQQEQRILQKSGDDFVQRSVIQEGFEPMIECGLEDCPKAYSLEYIIHLSGDINNISFPETLDHFIYRVTIPPTTLFLHRF